MRQLRAALLRIGNLFGWSRPDQDLDDEIEGHLQMEIDANLRAGMTQEEARRAAILRFDGIETVKESYRDRRGLPLVETTLQDARFAVRTLGRNRTATLLGIAIMALAIGANTAVFSVVHAVLLNPLPYANPDRIVTFTYIWSGGLASGERSRQVSMPDFKDWQAQSQAFEAMSYYTAGRTSVMAGPVAEYAVVARVSRDFFRVFAVRPAIGRLFAAEETLEGAAGAAILSDGYARTQFGEPKNALGRTLRFSDRAVPVVGVLPPGSQFPTNADIWFPAEAVVTRSGISRRGNNFLAIGLLKPDVSLQQAQIDMTSISMRLAQQYPDTNRDVRAVVTPLQREMVGDVRTMLYVLLGAVALVLLIACATMATLLLAKATARIPEIAVRTALGASRARIVKQLLVEASVQALAAGSIGVMIAVWGTRTLVALSPPNVPRLDEVTVNGRVLLFTLALSMLVSLLFGLPPALQAARVDINQPLRRNAGRIAGGGGRMREGLVVAEIALAVILVAGSGLLVRSLIALYQSPLGFSPENVLLMQATAPATGDWTDSRGFFRGLLDDVRQMPGVIAAGAMMGPPGRVSSESGYWLDRMPKEDPLRSARPAVINVIAPGSFAALGVPIREGRDFQDGDISTARPVAIVNDALARVAFGDRGAIGRVLVAGYDSDVPMTIIGVVGDVRQYGPGREPQPELYLPYQQHFYNGATLSVLVRTSMDPALLGPMVQRKAQERSPEVSVRLSTMEALLAEHVATAKFRAWLLSLFGVVALTLAMAGVYGVMAYNAGERSREIGVRMALGATARSVMWLMLGSGLKLTVLGLIAGTLGAFASTRFISGMLFQIGPNDLLTFIAVIAGLGLLSLIATYLPARRATRIDPLLVLRQE